MRYAVQVFSEKVEVEFLKHSKMSLVFVYQALRLVPQFHSVLLILQDFFTLGFPQLTFVTFSCVLSGSCGGKQRSLSSLQIKLHDCRIRRHYSIVRITQPHLIPFRKQVSPGVRPSVEKLDRALRKEWLSCERGLASVIIESQK